MEPVFVDLWGWFNTCMYEAYRSQDLQKIKLLGIHDEAWNLLETEPERSLSLFGEGVQLARQLRESCVAMFYEYWQCETYLFYLLDVPAAMNLAVKLTVEMQKPQYEQCPVRARIYRILVDSYLLTDSIGYENEINTNLDHLENKIPLDKDTWQILAARRIDLAFDSGQYVKALEHAQIYLSRAQGSDFRMRDAYELLCIISYKLNDLTSIYEYAQAGERHARNCSLIRSVANFQVWQAVYLESTGSHAAAKRLLHAALRRAAKLHNTFCPDSLCALYENAEDFERSVEVRKLQRAKAIKSGNRFEAAYRSLLCCQVLAKAGKPFDQEAVVARETISKLRKPERFMAILEQMERGKLIDF